MSFPDFVGSKDIGSPYCKRKKPCLLEIDARKKSKVLTSIFLWLLFIILAYFRASDIAKKTEDE